MATVLLYGDTVRYPAIRHEVPLEIVDPFLFVARDGDALVLTSGLEVARVREALPAAEVAVRDAFGFYELIDGGMGRDEAELETTVRALGEWGIGEGVVPGDFPVRVADRLRKEGVRVAVDDAVVDARRRVKTRAELEGVLRAQRAAEAGMAAGEALIRGAEHDGEHLRADGEVLTAEAVRGRARTRPAAGPT